MNRLINLGIVLGIVLIIVGCQKEEFSPTANSWEKTTSAVDYTTPDPESVFTPAPPTRTGSSYSPGSVFEPAVAITPGIYEPGTVFEPSGGGTTTGDNYPDASDHETSNLPALPNDINERGFAIHWQYEKPMDTKWQLIESISEETAGRQFDVAVPLCPYDDCDDAISQAVANFQAQANTLCQDIYACIACCMDGYVVYAMIVVYHECGIIAPPSDF